MRMNQHVYRFRRRSIDLISVRTQSRLFTCLLPLFHCYYVVDSSTSYGSRMYNQFTISEHVQYIVLFYERK